MSRRLRLKFQWLLTALGLNNVLHLAQFCDRCGRSGRKWPSWWADTALWEAVAGNVNGYHHGCFCIGCFNEIATSKGIHLRWKPEVSNALAPKSENR